MVSGGGSPSRRVRLVSKPTAPSTGLGRYVAELERGLRALGLDVAAAAPRDPLPAAIGSLGRRLGYDLGSFAGSYPLRLAVAPAAGTVTHLTSQTLATLLLGRRPPRPVVVTVHDILPFLLRDDPALAVYGHRLDRAMDGLAMRGLRRADRLVAVSGYTKTTLVDGLGIPAGQIDVVHNGVDLDRFAPRPVPAAFRARHGLAERGPLLLYVGSEDPRKNVAALLRALAVLRRGGVPATLLKVGAPAFAEQRARHRRLCDELGIAAAVRWLDAVSEDDLALFYSVADVFAFPSHYEGFGLPVLEALACGTAVVANATSSLPELVGEVGSLADAGDPVVFAAALAAALGRAGADDRQRRRAHAARFTWAATAAGVAATYERASAGG